MLAVALPLLAAGGGCSRETRRPITITTNTWPGYEPLYLAEKLGLLSKSDVLLHEVPSSSISLRAFRNGSVDAAALTLDETMLLLQDGVPLRILLVTDISVGADALLAKPGIATLADLKGKRVGAENTALGAFVLSRALETAGLTPRDITLVPITVDEHEDAFKEGKIDAVVTFEPVRSKLLANGSSVLFDSADIPGEILDVIVVREDIFRNRTDDVRRLAAAWFHATTHLSSHPAEDARLMSAREGLSPASFTAALSLMEIPSLEHNARLLSGKSPEIIPTAEKLKHNMLRRGLLEHDFKIDPAKLLPAGIDFSPAGVGR